VDPTLYGVLSPSVDLMREEDGKPLKRYSLLLTDKDSFQLPGGGLKP
jgi:hypothetical protein